MGYGRVGVMSRQCFDNNRAYYLRVNSAVFLQKPKILLTLY
jgi:hypothetical protein